MDARELMRDALVIDLHNDTIVAHIRRRNASVARRDVHYGTERNGVVTGPYGAQYPPEEPLQIDLQGMRECGIDLGFFAVDVTLAHSHHLAYGVDALGFLLHDLAQEAPDALIVKTRADLDLLGQSGPALLLHVEHADVTEGSLNLLYALHALGVRSMGLTHNVGGCAADGCWDARDGVGLTTYGVRLIREMNVLGMVVDLAHASPAAFLHALDVSTRPVLFSHGNARALCDNARNLTDDQLRALSAQGGVIGISFVPSFVDERAPTLGRLLDHFCHVAEVAGIEHVCLGSDFDGGGTLVSGVSGLCTVVEGLASRGFTEDDLHLILGENARSVLAAVLP